MWAFYENIRFSSGMSSHRTLACTWILLAHWTVVALEILSAVVVMQHEIQLSVDATGFK